MAPEKDVDVAVIGGGPAGSATAIAIALSRRGHSVVLIERSKYEFERVGEVLPPVIKNPLSRLGVLRRFLSDEHVLSFGIRSAWGQPDLYDNDFIFNPHGTGWHVDRRCFDAMLARASEDAGAGLLLGSRLVSCARVEGTGWDLEIACNDKRLNYRCKFLVDATGRTSAVALKQGAKRICYDRLIGVICYLPPRSRKTFDENYMLLEAVEDGWWYSAALPDLRLVVAYMTDSDLYSLGTKSSATYFWDQLRKAPHTASRAASYARTSDLRVLSANTYRMDRIRGRNWLAVGDAATAFDPLSSQGVYKALKSGLRAAQSIEDYLAGEETALKNHASWVNESFGQYLLLRREYYSRETRWSSSKFWQRRRN